MNLDEIEFLNPEFHPKFIVIHHSLTKDGQTVDSKAIRKYHMEVNGWSDVGYHFLVEKDIDEYRIVPGRPMLRPGAHVKGLNNQSMGICMVGNFDLAPVPQAQWDLTLRLTRKLQWFLHIPTDQVLGHREAQARLGVTESERKSCPGKMVDMDAFRHALTLMA
jgi:N-acetylmuramoyl-L-alanine amidase